MIRHKFSNHLYKCPISTQNCKVWIKQPIYQKKKQDGKEEKEEGVKGNIFFQ